MDKIYEVKHNPGSIVSRKIGHVSEYLDQLSDNITYISGGKFRRYLMNNYSLTLCEYYNLVVYGDKYKKHYCHNKECNKELHFMALNKPYNTCCCRKCNGKYTSDLLRSQGRLFMNTPEFRKIAVGVIKEMHSNGTHPFSKVEVHARSRKTDFIRKSLSNNRSIAYLYEAECTSDDSIFKIGVTSDIENYHGMLDLHNLKCMKKIAEGDIEYIADIEYKIKVHFNRRTEYYDKSMYSDVMNFINSIL